MERTDVIGKILDSYESRLRNNKLDTGVILYCCNYIYEYNPLTNEVRPFNSLIWYDLSDKFYSVTEYFKKEYNEVCNSTYDAVNLKNYGMILDNTLLLNIDRIRENLLFMGYNNCGNNNGIIVKEFNQFFDFIENLYLEWKKIAEFVIDNYTDIDNIQNQGE